MGSLNTFLLPHEYDALLESLRRDLRTQQKLAKSPGLLADWHYCNVRMTKRLLNILNPKRPFAGAIPTQCAHCSLGEKFAA